MRRGWIDEPLYSKIRGLLPIATVDLLVTHRGRLLLMKRNNQPAKDQWFTPGGRILLGETLHEAVRRVLREETGLTATRTEKKGAMSHIWPTTHAVTVYFRVEVADDGVEMNNEHNAYRWVSEVSDDLHPYLKEMIEESGVLQ